MFSINIYLSRNIYFFFIYSRDSGAQFLLKKKEKRNVHVVPQSQTAALPRHQEEEETNKTKQAQIEQTYEKL